MQSTNNQAWNGNDDKEFAAGLQVTAQMPTSLATTSSQTHIVPAISIDDLSNGVKNVKVESQEGNNGDNLWSSNDGTFQGIESKYNGNSIASLPSNAWAGNESETSSLTKGVGAQHGPTTPGWAQVPNQSGQPVGEDWVGHAAPGHGDTSALADHAKIWGKYRSPNRSDEKEESSYLNPNMINDYQQLQQLQFLQLQTQTLAQHNNLLNYALYNQQQFNGLDPALAIGLGRNSTPSNPSAGPLGII